MFVSRGGAYGCTSVRQLRGTTTHEADEACKDALELTKVQVERETRDVVVLVAVLAVVTMLVEMLSSLRWDGEQLAMTMSVPLTYPLIPGALVAYAIWRGTRGRAQKQAATAGIMLLAVPALILLGAFLLSAYTS